MIDKRHIIDRTHSQYPSLFRELHDSPKQLWVEGDLDVLQMPCLAIVGSRQATPYGLEWARRLAKELSQAGYVIVSGLAFGIDMASHEGALEGGQKTLSFLGQGLDQPLGLGRRDLRDRIISHGAIVSEYPPDFPGAKWTFPQRNRLISGLSLGVIVIEADLNSGSLITARWALEQNREVFAVPGPIDSKMSRGCHKLIQEGAKLVTCAADVVSELPRLELKNRPVQLSLGQGSVLPSPSLTEEENRIVGLLSQGPLSIDEIIELSGLPVSTLSESLMNMEMEGFVQKNRDFRYQSLRSAIT